MIFGVDSLYIWVAVIIIGVAVEAFCWTCRQSGLRSAALQR